MHEDEVPVGRAKDLRGKVFGRLTVLYRVKNRDKVVFWKCKCNCGAIKEIAGQALTSGRTVSCGCYNKEKCLGKKPTNFKDLTNMRFGNLTVIKEAPSNSQTKWECLCDCGNTTVVFAKNLLKGNHTTSCGCKKFSRYDENLVGMVFNRLTVLEKSDKICATGSMWKCQCECGNIVTVSRNHLITGHTNSCGCLSSQGELKISIIFNERNINFTTQQSFDSCRYENSERPPRFDFYVNNSYLIEYDGQQHFYPVDLFGGDEQFIIQQQRDAYKNQWCKDNNIPLIRIPYTKLDTLCIEDLMLETTQFRVV